MSSENSNPFPVTIIVAAGMLAYVGWQVIKSVAEIFGAAPRETGWLMASMLLATILAGVTIIYDVFQISWRTVAFAWFTAVFGTSHAFLSSIANGGVSPDDPTLWHFETAWYSSWITFAVILGLSAMATVWSWRRDRAWY